MRTLPAAIAAVCLCACTPASDLGQILPDDRLLIDEGELSGLARSVGEPSEFYQMTYDTTSEVNSGINDVLSMVEMITSFDPSWSNPEQDTALWGPWLDDGFHGQLWVTESSDGYAWAVELRPEGTSEDEWTAVVAGAVDPGASEASSTGSFVLDFTAIEQMGAGDGVVGAMAVEYDLFEAGAEATVFFGDISEDGSIPQDAGLHYSHEAGQGGQMDLAITEDVSDPANGVLELLVIRSRWISDGSGRADALVTEGDLGALTFTATECWDASHSVVFEENNYDFVRDGDEDLCAFSEASFSE